MLQGEFNVPMSKKIYREIIVQGYYEFLLINPHYFVLKCKAQFWWNFCLIVDRHKISLTLPKWHIYYSILLHATSNTSHTNLLTSIFVCAESIYIICHEFSTISMLLWPTITLSRWVSGKMRQSFLASKWLIALWS